MPNNNMRKRLQAMSNVELVVHYNLLEDALRSESITTVNDKRHAEIDAARQELATRGVW